MVSAEIVGSLTAAVWGCVDRHEIPEMYLRHLIDRDQRVSDVQLSSVGYEDPVTGKCWRGNWKEEPAANFAVHS